MFKVNKSCSTSSARIGILNTDNGKIEYLQDDLENQDKSIIYTSGSGALFKPGIPVGIVSKKTEVNNVNFFSNLSQLTFVKLVSYKKENY